MPFGFASALFSATRRPSASIGLVLDDVGDDLRVLLRDPAVEARDAHGARATARRGVRRRARFGDASLDGVFRRTKYAFQSAL